jgi:hypothetical protein
VAAGEGEVERLMLLGYRKTDEKEENEKGGIGGGFYCRRGNVLMEGFMLWLFTTVLRLWRLKTWWREREKRENYQLEEKN